MKNVDSVSRLNNLKSKKTYRPTVVCIIKNHKNQFLLVRSSMDENHWYFPQGGINKEESVLDAFYRELYEELQIMVLELDDIKENLHYGELTIKNYNLGEYKKGKAYFFVLANYVGPSRFILKKDEVSRYKWADPETAKTLLMQSMKAKGELNIKAMEKVLELK